jgi:hypothetical protein
MYQNPHTHLAIARARHEDMLRQADHDRLVRSLSNGRPGVFSRLWAHVSSRREAHSRPVTV